jgi:DNA-binding response OmpR family regulator
MCDEKKKILIVEDEFIVAADIKMTLQKLNYRVTSSIDNGEDAIKITALEKPDLILMDITLKGSLDGIETAKIIMTKYNIPIIYLSALNDEQTIYKALSTKPIGYLIKPFAPVELHTAIQSVFVKSPVF